MKTYKNKFYSGRRSFLKTSLVAGISVFCSPLSAIQIEPNKVKYNLSLDNPYSFFDGKSCFVHLRGAIVPGSENNWTPRVVMTMSLLDLSGSDVFKATYGMETNDLGKTWTNPKKLDNLAPVYENNNGEKHPVALCDFWPKWNKNSKILLGTGNTADYTPKWKAPLPRSRHTSYALYNPEEGTWSDWQKMKMPDYKKFYNCGAGSAQRYDKEDGTILLPVYFLRDPRVMNFSVTVLRCSLHDKKLEYLEHGDEISIDADGTRGLFEPSITFFKEEYFLTIRNDKNGFVARSQDGLHFSPVERWKFDDGSDLGSYNTQQHWVTHSDGLFLVYTRKGANNDNVFRNRAPLFMAQVDPVKLCVVRETEQILAPNRGARLGNFGVTDVSPNETWVTVSEWMQPKGVEKYGSDGRLWVSRIHWSKPNQLFNV